MIHYQKRIIFSIIFSMIIIPSDYIIGLSIPIILIYTHVYKSTAKIFFRKSTYLLFIIIVIIQPILIGESNQSFYFIKYNQEIFWNGLGMFCRSIVIISSISILNHKADEDRIIQFWKNFGLEEFENVFMKAQEILPAIKSNLFNSPNKLDHKFSLINKPSTVLAKIIVAFLYKSSNSTHLTKED